MPGIDESRHFIPLKIAVLTVSDTRDLADDKSGATLAERIRAAGHLLTERAIVKDEVEAIRGQVKDWIADKAIDVIITTGGTGFTGRDVTPEAIEPLFEKRMEGFATLFLMVSYNKIGTSAIQTSRTRRTSSACPARPAPARMPGTKSWCTNSTIGTGRAILSRSCRGSTSICGGRRREEQRFEA